MNNAYAVVFKIDNGYLVTEVDGDRSVYVKEFSLDALISPPLVDHETILKALVFAAPATSKIQAIRAVRLYCNDKGYAPYSGLKDAKDYVERMRNDWYYLPAPIDPFPSWGESE